MDNDKKTNGFAIAALVLSILGLISCMTIFGGIILGILGLIFAIIAIVKKSKITLPTVSIILSSIAIMASVVIMICLAIVGVAFSGVVKGFNEYFNYGIDLVSGSEFEEDDGSYIIFNNDGTFKYYKDKNDLTNNYYEGTYEVRMGEDAIEYIANDLSKYGVTEKEQRDLIERSSKYDISNYYSIVLNNNSCMVDGKNTLSSEIITPYMGFYYSDSAVLDIVNMNTATYYIFEKK